MSEDLQNEIEAINSIYGPKSLVPTDQEDIFVLHLPEQAVSLRLRFPPQYPAVPPAVLGTESSGDHRKGQAVFVLEAFRDALGRLFQPGEVCLFDIIEEVNNNPAGNNNGQAAEQEDQDSIISNRDPESVTSTSAMVKTIHPSEAQQPAWTTSDVVIELKSVFVARCAAVSSPDQARHYLQNLLDGDKKIRSATHNITAWRIQGKNGVAFQDCDDDGETAAGGRLLHLMQLMDLWDVMVVVTRWYGGHQLGPKRFSIINSVARDAFVKGNFVKEETTAKKQGKR